MDHPWIRFKGQSVSSSHEPERARAQRRVHTFSVPARARIFRKNSLSVVVSSPFWGNPRENSL